MNNSVTSFLKLGVIAFLLAIASTSHAQQDTLKKKTKYVVGFNLVGLTSIDANTSLVVGGKGGFYIGKKLFFGGRAAIIPLNERYFEEVEEPEFGYIGPMLGYHVWRKERLQASVLAATGLAIIDYEQDAKKVRDRALFILPSAELEYFFSDNIAIGLELGYRSVQRVQQAFSNTQLSGMEFALSLKFGRRP